MCFLNSESVTNKNEICYKNVTNLNMKQIEKKIVSFSNMCKVILIATRYEYLSAGIVLWWSKEDFNNFRQNYLIEKNQLCNKIN